MKLNTWTLGLAAVGAVSLASAARAEEAKLTPVQTAVSNTTISGSVSSSLNWTWSPSNGDVPKSPAGNIPLQSGKQNGFNLDLVKVSIAKAQDESATASGYNVDLLFGPDAVGWNPVQGNATSKNEDFAIQQAFIALRTPVGDGINLKVGVYNTIIGYESLDAASNPNYTRSWGWAVEPTEHTGVQGNYQVNDEWLLQWGCANTLNNGINTRNTYDTAGVNNSQWHKTLMGAVAFTAPSSWGWAAGSSLYAGVVYGFAGGTEGVSDSGNTIGAAHVWHQGSSAGSQGNYYAGATLNSPWKDVTFGATFDYVQNVGGTDYALGDATGAITPFFHINDYVFGFYNTIKATDKLSFNSRAEYWEVDAFQSNYVDGDGGVSLTETVSYDIWGPNVISRVEFRYDKVTSSISKNGQSAYILPNGVFVSDATSYGLYANIVYKF